MVRLIYFTICLYSSKASSYRSSDFNKKVLMRVQGEFKYCFSCCYRDITVWFAV